MVTNLRDGHRDRKKKPEVKNIGQILREENAIFSTLKSKKKKWDSG